MNYDHPHFIAFSEGGMPKLRLTENIAKKIIDLLFGKMTPDKADQLILECRCTDILQGLADTYNSNYLTKERCLKNDYR